MPRLPPAVVALVVVTGAWACLVAQSRMDAFVDSRHHPAIAYGRVDIDNPVAALNARLAAGEARLPFDPETGYLRATLEALDVSPESQVLVYSPTSFQASRISRNNPRAIYFNDSVSVGWIRGADLLELTVQDPRHGTLFYTIGQSAVARPEFGRQEQCVSCHLSWDTLGVPGLTVKTTYPGRVRGARDGGAVDHRRPMSERWGGWFVTGRSVPAPHPGNRPLDDEGEAPVPPLLESVAEQFDTTGYLRTTSDVVALMVLEHQTQAANMITRLGWEARLGDEARTRAAAAQLADYLLFVDEAPLAGPVAGGDGFAQAFTARGARDRRGRSLRDLDLQRRLMRYPLSYMIGTPAFAGLPGSARTLVLERLDAVLSGRDQAAKYAHLTPDVRTAIRDILDATVPALLAGGR